MLGQLDAPQALSDIQGLRLMLHKVPNEALRQQLALSADQCEKAIREALAQDLDAAPGIECVTRLYETFESARRVPAAPAASTKPGQPAQTISNSTMYWIAGIGALAVVFMSSLTAD